MAISNIHETLLMYTKQKSAINARLSEVMLNMVSASRRSADLQKEYNEKLQEAMKDYFTGSVTEEQAWENFYTKVQTVHKELKR